MPSSHQPGKLRKLYHTLWRFAAKRPASIIVSISLMIFLFLWVEGLIGTYATTVGTILGSVAIAVSSIGKGPDRDKWIFAAAGTILVGACAALDKAGELHALKLKNELEKEIQGYPSQSGTQRQFAAYVAERLKICLNTAPADLDHCDDLVSLLELTDADNGSVYYFKAEILRYRGMIDESRAPFYEYLDKSKQLYPIDQFDSGTTKACQDNGTGYCHERTAWVCHSLANDLYRRACNTVGGPQRLDLFKRAQEMLDCVVKEYPRGFEQRLGSRPLNTVDLTEALTTQIKAPTQACPASPSKR